ALEERQREAHPGSRKCVGTISNPEFAAVRFHESTADVQAQPGPLNVRFADVTSTMEWLQHQRSIGLRNPKALVVDSDSEPFRGGNGSDRDRAVRWRIFQGVANHVFEYLPDTHRIHLEKRQVLKLGCRQTRVLTGCDKVTSQTRDQRCE